MRPHARTTSSQRRARAGERGFSFIEMMVAMGIFLVVTAAIYGLLRVATSDRFTSTQKIEALQNARVAMNALNRDATNAGADFPNAGVTVPPNRLAAILGIKPLPTLATADRITPIVSGQQLPMKIVSAGPPATYAAGPNDEVLMIYRDDAFNNGNALNVATTTPNPGITNNLASTPKTCSVKIDTSGGVTNSVCNVGELYVVQGQTSAALGWLTGKSGTDTLVFNGADPLLINQPGVVGTISQLPGPSAVPPTPWNTYIVYRVTMVMYYVDPADATKTLVRKVFGTPQSVTGQTVDTTADGYAQPVSQDVQSIAFNYILQSGQPTPNPMNVTVTGTTITDQRANIRQMQAVITVNSPDTDRLGRVQTMKLENTFSLRNLAVNVKRPS